MKTKLKKIKPLKRTQTERRTLHNPSICSICLFIFALAISPPSSVAKNQNQYLDPTDLLSSYNVQNPNEPKHLEHPMKINAVRKKSNQSPLNDTVPINFEIQIEQNQPNQKEQTRLALDDSPSRNLLRTSLSVIGNNDSNAKNELQKLINKINSAKFISQKTTAPKKEKNRIQPPPDKNEPTQNAGEKQKPENTTKTPLPDNQIAPETLQMIEESSRRNQQIKNPLELAEILYLSNNFKKAAELYQMALKQINDNTEADAQQKAWILFQLGNCLKHSDKQKAIQFYRKLITQFPDSIWTQTAKSREKITDWYLKAQPEKLISENKS